MFQTKTLTADVVAEYVASYNDGKATLATIAVAIGCSVPTAGRLLKRAGAQMRSKGRPKGSKTVNRKPRTAPAQAVPPAPQTVETPSVDKLAASPAGEGFLAFQQRVLDFKNS